MAKNHPLVLSINATRYDYFRKIFNHRLIISCYNTFMCYVEKMHKSYISPAFVKLAFPLPLNKQHFIFGLLFVLLCAFFTPQIKANTLYLSEFEAAAIGKNIEYFQESTEVLTLEKAIQTFNTKDVRQGTSDSISLGIGVDPVWLKFTINNDVATPKPYRFTVETPWLDNIDSWLVQNNNVIKHIHGGDGVPFEQRPMQYRYYGFETQLPHGITQIYIRVESIGPMAIPVRLSTVEQAINRDISSGYQYGVLYGIMSALALYNLVLFAFIRQKEYGLYGLYLLGFVLNSLSYTGQIHAVFTPDYGPYFQDWVDIFLMITYSVAGLHFARHLLGTKAYAPKLDKFVVQTTVIIPTGMIIGFIFDQLVFSITLAFILNCGFVTLFIGMGIKALQANKAFAVIFLFSSVVAALCITISSLAVAGFLIPYNDYTFKLIEVGMALEAILLAVILARQFRTAKIDKIIAETHARCDSLTQLNNRHGFKEITSPIWQSIIREKRDVSLVILDIDFFKDVNDNYGHSAGDEALKAVADCISRIGRKGDIAARWGGEEFLILLPETSQEHAKIQAERLRSAIERIVIETDHGETFKLTTSVGVAGSESAYYEEKLLTDIGLEYLINQADKALYLAKNSGKNQVCIAD